MEVGIWAGGITSMEEISLETGREGIGGIILKSAKLMK